MCLGKSCWKQVKGDIFFFLNVILIVIRFFSDSSSRYGCARSSFLNFALICFLSLFGSIFDASIITKSVPNMLKHCCEENCNLNKNIHVKNMDIFYRGKEESVNLFLKK